MLFVLLVGNIIHFSTYKSLSEALIYLMYLSGLLSIKENGVNGLMVLDFFKPFRSKMSLWSKVALMFFICWVVGLSDEYISYVAQFFLGKEEYKLLAISNVGAFFQLVGSIFLFKERIIGLVFYLVGIIIAVALLSLMNNFMYGLFTGVFSLLLLAVVLYIKKDGVSAWKILK